MAQNIDDIIKELDAGYNPQRQSINNRLAQLPGQAEAEIGGLKAQQETSFNDITDGARSRGMGFSGIPIAEQAKYTANSFLPAVARVRQSQNEVSTSLTDAMNGINTEQRNKAFGIRETQLGREQEESQFQRNLSAQRDAENRADARSRAAAGDGGAGALSSLFGGGGEVPTAPVNKADPYSKINKQGASNAIVGLLRSKDPARIQATIKAIQASANRGNAYDKFKLEYLNSLQGNSSYGDLIKKANAYKPAKKPAPKPVVNQNSIINARNSPFASRFNGGAF